MIDKSRYYVHPTREKKKQYYELKSKWYQFQGQTGELLERKPKDGVSQIRLARSELIGGGERILLEVQGYLFRDSLWKVYYPPHGDRKRITKADYLIYDSKPILLNREIIFPDTISYKDFDANRKTFLADYFGLM